MANLVHSTSETTNQSVLEAILSVVKKNPPLPEKITPCSIVGKHEQVFFLDPRRIRILPENPRQKTNPGLSNESLEELGLAIKATGQRDAVKVCLLNEPDTYGRDFDAQLFDGERRIRACILAGIMVKVQVDEIAYPDQVLQILAVASNHNKETHTCVEIAYEVNRFRNMRMTYAEIGQIFGGKCGAWAQQHENLMKLDPAVLALLVTPPELPVVIDGVEVVLTGDKKQRRRKSVLSFLIALTFVDLPADDQKRVARHIVENGLSDVSARRYLEQFRREEGKLKEAKRGRKIQQRMFEKFDNLTQQVQEEFGIFQDMKRSEFIAFISKKSASERGKIFHRMNELVKTVNMLISWMKALDH